VIVGLHHASITTGNLDRLSAFYCGHLGFELVLETSWEAGNARADAIYGLKDTAVRMAMLRLQNCFLELFEFATPTGDPRPGRRPVCDQGITHICIAVDDLDAEYNRLVGAGMHFNCPPQDVPGLCRATYGHDPDGNIVEVMEFDLGGPFAFRAATPG
jgi:catechol 2,3-dioxygenase-like lactoylglutathione lyase family enzyme